MTQNPKPITSHLSRYWLLIGVSALAVAGLFALVLVIARTPSLSNIPLFATLFREALAVHVDLSVLVWFLSIACLMWSLLAADRPPVIPYIEEAALISFGLGALAIAASAFDPKGAALMSNYVPTITSPVFFLGLSLLLCGVGLMLVRALLPLPPGEGRGEGPALILSKSPNPLPEGEGMRYAIRSAGIIALIAILAFFWSFKQMPHDLSGEGYYEQLFWGGGHVLQFLHVQIVMVVWLLLTKALKPEFSVYKPHLYILFSIGLVCSFCVPFAYMHYAADDPMQKMFFTYLMILTNGIAPLLLSLYIIPGLWRIKPTGFGMLNRKFAYQAAIGFVIGGLLSVFYVGFIVFFILLPVWKREFWRVKSANALWSALFMSIFLFVYGGVLGSMIQGQNVVIPAHYHGSIVGVTLAFMGAAYMFLPQFGYKDVSGSRMAFWQPIVYGGGQLLHVSGLAWSGGYGVLRKTPGGMDGLSIGVKAAMGVMGIGGLIAIIGGFMFVIVVGKAIFSEERKSA